MPREPDLPLAEWIVLALIAERPSHGFAVVALTTPDAEIGQIWHVSRPMVYRSITRLAERRLVRPRGTYDSDRGPQRTVFEVTARGKTELARWLRTPVEHLRDLRSDLLVKLALLHRRGDDIAPLVREQKAVFAPIESALAAKDNPETAFTGVLLSWRLEHARAALRFLEALPGGEP